jgi:hypothetical protein
MHAAMREYLADALPRPAEMKPDVYGRNIAARAFDVARYCLFLGIPTGVGQVVSIRTLERQIRRLKSSEYSELVSLADELGAACSQPPACRWSEHDVDPIAPTLARHVSVDSHAAAIRKDLRIWAAQNLSRLPKVVNSDIDLFKPSDTLTDIAATLLYSVTSFSYRALYEDISAWSSARRMEVVDVALRSRTSRDELSRHFRSAPYVFDIVMDIGAYRDLHRHRRCQQLRQDYTIDLGYEVPALVSSAKLENEYRRVMQSAFETVATLPAAARDYLLPFAAKSRFLFKMDFAEAEYICRLRTGVKGHFSYREVAWKMKLKMDELEPDLGKFISATPPWVEDPLKR